MAEVNATPSQAIIFRGSDAEEAETFIQAVRQLAYVENKDDDNGWMARFAMTCFRGRAMRWHAKLDQAVQRDWYLLVQSILDEWTSGDDRDGHDRGVSSM